jgi:uncharacterized membrane protein
MLQHLRLLSYYFLFHKTPQCVINLNNIGILKLMIMILIISLLKITTPWLLSTSDRRLSAKLVPSFPDRGVSRGQPSGSLLP